MKKTILFLFLVILCSFASASLTPSVIDYYPFNETSASTTPANDANSSRNGVCSAGSLGTFGRFNGSMTMASNSRLCNFGNLTEIFGSDMGTRDWSLNIWVNVTNSGGNNVDLLLKKQDCTGIAPLIQDASTGTGFNIGIREVGVNTFALNTGADLANNWIMLTLVWNSTDDKIYGWYNSTPLGSTSGYSVTTTCGANLSMYPQANAGNYLWDDLSIWSRKLTQAEINTLWNSGNGNTPYNFSSVEAAFVFPTPTDGYHTNTQEIINASCSDSVSDTLIWFDTNANPITLVQTTAGYANYTTSMTIETTYYYKASCDNGATNTSTRTLIYDVTKPNIVLNPNNFFTSLNTSRVNQYTGNNLLILNITILDNSTLYGFEVNITNSTTGTAFYYNATANLTTSTYNYTNLINYSTWSSGFYNISIWASDTHTKKKIDDYTISRKNKEIAFFTAENNNIRISTETDAEFTAVKSIDRYKINVKYDKAKAMQDKVFNLFCDGELKYFDDNYKAHFTCVKDDNWKQYGGNWIDFEGIDGTPLIKKTSSNSYKITFFDAPNEISFNSVGGLNVNYKSYLWYRGKLINNTATGYKGINQTFTLNVSNISTSRITNISANLVYNHTIYSATKTISNGFVIFSASSVTLPILASTTLNANIEYFWNITIGQIDANTATFADNNTQTVYGFNISGCKPAADSSAIQYNRSINISFLDEKNNSYIWVDTTTLYNYTYDGVTYYTYTNDETNINSTSICIYPSGINLSVDYHIFYSKGTTYPQRRYYQTDEVWTNATINRTLYGLSYLYGIYGRFKTLDSYSNAISGVIGQMKNGIGTLIEQEETDASGTATFWLNPDVDYTFIFSKVGYAVQTLILRIASNDVYNVYMETPSTSTPDYGEGILTSFLPNLGILNNGTAYNFTFNLSSSYWLITDCTFVIKDSADNTLSSASPSNNGSLCGAVIALNTGKNTTLTAYATYELNNTQTQTASRIYSVTSYSFSDVGTLKAVIDDISNLASSGFDDKTRVLVAFLVTLIVVGWIGYKFNALVNPEPALIALWGCVLLFSYSGWLTMGLSLPTDVAGLTNQWAIFILTTIIVGSYIAWRHT